MGFVRMPSLNCKPSWLCPGMPTLSLLIYPLHVPRALQTWSQCPRLLLVNPFSSLAQCTAPSSGTVRSCLPRAHQV